MTLRDWEWVFTILFTIEYILRCPRRRIRCAMHPASSALSICWQYCRPTSTFCSGAHYLLVVRLLRVLRIFRILKLAHIPTS
jgi:voltage-gated potassium channel